MKRFAALIVASAALALPTAAGAATASASQPPSMKGALPASTCRDAAPVLGALAKTPLKAGTSVFC